MRKHGKLLSIFCVLALISGCGHSVLVESEVTGFAIKVPIGEGGSLGVTLGSAKLTTATIRGGTTLETTSCAGGGIFSGDGGLNRITTFKTNAQLNEGNLRDVMLSENVPDEAKVVLASNLCIAAKAPKVAQTVLQTPTTTIHTGEATVSNNVPAVNHVSGVDKIVETLPAVVTPVVNVIPNTVQPVTDTVSNVSTGIVNSVIDGVTTITDQVNHSVTDIVDDTANAVKDIKWMTLIKWLGLIIFAAIAGYFGWTKLGSRKPRNSRPAHVMVPVDPDALPPEVEKEVVSAAKEVQDELPLDYPESPVEPPEEPIEPPPKKEDETAPTEEKEEEPKTPWYKKVITFFSICYSLFMKIPADKRKRLYEMIKQFVTEWIKKKKAEKQSQQKKSE